MYSALVQGNDGDLYGNAPFGGVGDPSICILNIGGCGTLFKITTSGKLSVVYTFCTEGNGCPNGAGPFGLVQASDGNFYGTAGAGGTLNNPYCIDNSVGCGTIFKVTPGGELTTLYNFCSEAGCSDGRGAVPLVQATDGNFYGATYGGSCYQGNYCSIIFKLSVGLPPFVKLLPDSGSVGLSLKILGTDLAGTTSVSFNGDPAEFEIISPTEIEATVPIGATTGKVTVVTPGGTLVSNVAFRVTAGFGGITTLVSSTPNPSNFGQPVTFTATFTSQSGATPTGTVTFSCGGTKLGVSPLNSSGVATLTTSALAVGTHRIAAVYGGDSNYPPITSTVLDQLVQGAILQLSTTRLNFGEETVGFQSAAQEVTLKNAGNVASAVRVEITGANPFNFAQTTNCSPSIAANGSCVILVLFQPLSAGARTGALSISDSAPNSPQKVWLSGVGVQSK